MRDGISKCAVEVNRGVAVYKNTADVLKGNIFYANKCVNVETLGLA